MKTIRLIPIDEEFDDYEDYEDYEDLDAEEGPRFDFDLTPYLIACAIACGVLFVVRFVEKRVLRMR